MIKHINSVADFESAVQTGTKLVDFWATWCGPCKMMGAVIEAKILPARPDVDLIKVDVDQAPELAVKFGVQSIPYLLVYKAGKVTKEFIGVTSAEEVLAALA